MLGPCTSCVFRQEEVKVIGDAPVEVCHRYPTPMVIPSGHRCGEYKEALKVTEPTTDLYAKPAVEREEGRKTTPRTRNTAPKVTTDEAQTSPAD